MKLAYLGPKGSYSSLAAERFAKTYDTALVLEEVSTIYGIFQVVEEQPILGIVPLENSTSGDVYDTYASLVRNDVQIMREIILPIQHALVVKKGVGVEKIKTIYSHPQALLQITTFTTENRIETIATQSTMDACMVILEQNDETVAAVAQSDAVKQLTELEALPLAISNYEYNFTRFLVLKSGIQQLFEGNTLFMIFSLVQDAPGGLTAILEIIATYHINMKSIKSRPIEGAHFQYYFIIEGTSQGISDKMYRELKETLLTKTASLRFSVYETEEI